MGIVEVVGAMPDIHQIRFNTKGRDEGVQGIKNSQNLPDRPDPYPMHDRTTGRPGPKH